jgi:hypothetical protein
MMALFVFEEQVVLKMKTLRKMIFGARQKGLFSSSYHRDVQQVLVYHALKAFAT